MHCSDSNVSHTCRGVVQRDSIGAPQRSVCGLCEPYRQCVHHRSRPCISSCISCCHPCISSNLSRVSGKLWTDRWFLSRAPPCMHLGMTKTKFCTPIKYTLDCVKLTFGGSYTHTQSSWVRPHGPQITCHCEGFLDLDYRVIIIFRLSTKLDKNQWTSWTGPP